MTCIMIVSHTNRLDNFSQSPCTVPSCRLVGWLNRFIYRANIARRNNACSDINGHYHGLVKNQSNFSSHETCNHHFDKYSTGIIIHNDTRLRALTWRGMLSTWVRTLLGRTAAHAWWTSLFSSARVEGGGGHPCLGSRLTFHPKHAQLGSCLDSELASLWPRNPVSPKRLPCHVLHGVGPCLGRTQSYAQTPTSPMSTFHSSGSGCIDAGSWLQSPRPAHSYPMVDCTPYHVWRATISITGLDAGINQPLPLPTAHPDPTVTVV